LNNSSAFLVKADSELISKIDLLSIIVQMHHKNRENKKSVAIATLFKKWFKKINY